MKQSVRLQDSRCFCPKIWERLWQTCLLRSDAQYLTGAQGWIRNHLSCEQQHSVTAPGWFYCSAPQYISSSWQWQHAKRDILGLISPFVASFQALEWLKSRGVSSRIFPCLGHQIREKGRKLLCFFSCLPNQCVWWKRVWEGPETCLCSPKWRSSALFFLQKGLQRDWLHWYNHDKQVIEGVYSQSFFSEIF